MKVAPDREEQILAALKAFFAAYANREIHQAMALFVPDPDVILIGTESDERLVGHDQIRARFESDWSRSDELSMALGWYSISGAGDTCWLAADIVVHIRADGNSLELPARITVVWERRAGTWLISQWHASIPAG